jgi:toxin HigB-1
MIYDVRVTRRAEKELRSAPIHIQQKFQLWVEAIGKFGLENVRKVPGYHDEPLKGTRKGQRSVRLSRAYRAIYEVLTEEVDGKQIKTMRFVSVEEISKHKY